MRFRANTMFIAAFLCLAPVASQADLSPYGPQDFEGMLISDPAALSADGWWVYGNIFDPEMNRLYGYGPYGAPNGPLPGAGPAFSVLVTGEGGDTQGLQQLSVFSNYEDGNHAVGNLVESNVFQEQSPIGAADVGNTWYFEFDAKRGNIELGSTALAFIKTLDPNAGYALTNFITVDMTSIPDTWNRYSLSIFIDAGLVGQILQFGFANTATNYEGSGIFYDNVVFSLQSSLDVTPVAAGGIGIQLSARGNPAIGQQAQVLAFTLPRDGRATVRVYDVSGALVTTLVDGELGAGAQQVTWRGRDAAGRPVAPGMYLAEVAAGGERAVTKLSRLR